MLFTAIYSFTRFAINSSLLACVCTLHLVDHLLEALSGFLTNPISSKKPWLTTIKHQFFNLLFYANSFFWFASTVSWRNMDLKKKTFCQFANYSKLDCFFNSLYFQIRKYFLNSSFMCIPLYLIVTKYPDFQQNISLDTSITRKLNFNCSF